MLGRHLGCDSTKFRLSPWYNCQGVRRELHKGMDSLIRRSFVPWLETSFYGKCRTPLTLNTIETNGTQR